MLRIIEKPGFSPKHLMEDGLVHAESKPSATQAVGGVGTEATSEIRV